MSMTEYVVLSRYYNPTINSCVTNGTQVNWIGHAEKDEGLKKTVQEIIKIDNSKDGSTSAEMQRLIIENARRNNPKFDMMFYYTGVDMIGEALPYVVCDQFKRIQGDPWVVNSYIGSLTGAMERAKRLASKLGKENVLFGKVVPLEQYITIV